MGTMYKAFVHPEILCFLDEQKKIRKLDNQQLFRFPWGSGGTAANPEFWLRLLARDVRGRGWLSDSVCTSYKYKILLINSSPSHIVNVNFFFLFLYDSILDYLLI